MTGAAGVGYVPPKHQLGDGRVPVRLDHLAEILVPDSEPLGHGVNAT